MQPTITFLCLLLIFLFQQIQSLVIRDHSLVLNHYVMYNYCITLWRYKQTPPPRF